MQSRSSRQADCDASLCSRGFVWISFGKGCQCTLRDFEQSQNHRKVPIVACWERTSTRHRRPRARWKKLKNSIGMLASVTSSFVSWETIQRLIPFFWRNVLRLPSLSRLAPRRLPFLKQRFIHSWMSILRGFLSKFRPKRKLSI